MVDFKKDPLNNCLQTQPLFYQPEQPLKCSLKRKKLLQAALLLKKAGCGLASLLQLPSTALGGGIGAFLGGAAGAVALLVCAKRGVKLERSIVVNSALCGARWGTLTASITIGLPFTALSLLIGAMTLIAEKEPSIKLLICRTNLLLYLLHKKCNETKEELAKREEAPKQKAAKQEEASKQEAPKQEEASNQDSVLQSPVPDPAQASENLSQSSVECLFEKHKVEIEKKRLFITDQAQKTAGYSWPKLIEDPFQSFARCIEADLQALCEQKGEVGPERTEFFKRLKNGKGITLQLKRFAEKMVEIEQLKEAPFDKVNKLLNEVLFHTFCIRELEIKNKIGLKNTHYRKIENYLLSVSNKLIKEKDQKQDKEKDQRKALLESYLKDDSIQQDSSLNELFSTLLKLEQVEEIDKDEKIASIFDAFDRYIAAITASTARPPPSARP